MIHTVLLGDICIQITDGTHSTVKNTDDGSYFLLSAKNIKDKVFISNNERKIDKGTLENLRKRTKTAKDDILVTSVGTIGEMAIIEDVYPDYEFQRSVAILKPDQTKVVPKYLYYYLRNIKQKLVSMATGAVQKCLFIGQIKNIKIDLPDLETQKKIADILGSLDEKIELNRKMNETLEQMGQALFRHYFIDNPEASKWKKVKINDVVLINKRGFSPKYSDSGIPVINQRCVRNGTVVEEAIQYHDNAQKQAPNSAYLQPNDILINSMGVGTLGRVSQVYSSPREYIVHSCITILRANPDIIDPIILGYYMKYLEPSIAQMGSGTTGQTSLNNNLLGNIEIILLDKKIQNFISTTMYSLVVRIDENYAQIKTLIYLRDMLLPRLISGKIKL